MSIELPVLQDNNSPAHVFRAAELARCGEGDCCRCGRCCYLYDVPSVPNVPGEAFKPKHVSYSQQWFHFKAAGVMCPQHVWNENGLSTCLCHNQKDTAPVLGDCKEFEPGPSTYSHVREVTAQFLKKPESVDEVKTMIEWLKMGLLSDVEVHIESADEAANILMQYISFCEMLPVDLLYFINMHNWVSQFNKNQIQGILAKASARGDTKLLEKVTEYCNQNSGTPVYSQSA